MKDDYIRGYYIEASMPVEDVPLTWQIQIVVLSVACLYKADRNLCSGSFQGQC
ncbi:hypothetical protein ACFLTN_00580 [Chloroflexota bacterium]